MKRLVVMVSGFGSNLQAIMDACRRGEIQGQVVAVFANRKAGLERAREAGIDAVYRPLKPFKGSPDPRAAYDEALARDVAVYKPDFVILAGWMRILTPAFLRPFGNRVINLHPALPGHFAGTHAIERAFAAWQDGQIEHTGVMVHRVVEEVDAGPVLATAVVPFEPGDSLERLAERVHKTEHRILVEAIAGLCAPT